MPLFAQKQVLGQAGILNNLSTDPFLGYGDMRVLSWLLLLCFCCCCCFSCAGAGAAGAGDADGVGGHEDDAKMLMLATVLYKYSSPTRRN